LGEDLTGIGGRVLEAKMLGGGGKRRKGEEEGKVRRRMRDVNRIVFMESVKELREIKNEGGFVEIMDKGEGGVRIQVEDMGGNVYVELQVCGVETEAKTELGWEYVTGKARGGEIEWGRTEVGRMVGGTVGREGVKKAVEDWDELAIWDESETPLSRLLWCLPVFSQRRGACDSSSITLPHFVLHVRCGLINKRIQHDNDSKYEKFRGVRWRGSSLEKWNFLRISFTHSCKFYSFLSADMPSFFFVFFFFFFFFFFVPFCFALSICP